MNIAKANKITFQPGDKRKRVNLLVINDMEVEASTIQVYCLNGHLIRDILLNDYEIKGALANLSSEFRINEIKTATGDFNDGEWEDLDVD